MIDLHSHTKFSADSKELPENHLRAAIDMGCKVFGFSEHLDYDYIVNSLHANMTDVGAYYQSTEKLKREYEGQIEVLCGIEFAYGEGADGMYRKTLAAYHFDYVINSVHVTDGKDCYFTPYFEGKEKEYAYERYLQTVLKSIDAEYDYQIVGHIGYVARNAPYEQPALEYSKHKKTIDNILKLIIEKEKTLEINTNVNTAGSPFLPYLEIIRRYRELGGKLFTFGSDCHQASRVCDNYGLVAQTLKDLGYSELAVYKQRKLQLVEI